MKAIILAAGRGTRLAPLTNSMPKCMVKYKGKSIIDYEIDALNANGIYDIAVVGGYLSDVLRKHVKTNYFFINHKYSETNMVWTLFSAIDFINMAIDNKDDLIISYADIVYTSNIVSTLKNYDGEFGVIIDTQWKKLWENRFENILDDAESLVIHNNKIIDIGNKVSSIDNIQGQYIGLFKISYKFLPSMIKFYNQLKTSLRFDEHSFKNMYMTRFLQEIINEFGNIEPVFIDRGWIEVDSKSDLEMSL